jgi:uncharacterized glyoxalase superfamily protein PhnB
LRSQSKMKYRDAIPVIAAADLAATMKYYSSVLGFRKHFVYGDPPVYAGMTRDDMLLYMTLDEEMVAKLREAGLHHDVFMWVENVDEVYREHLSSGAKIVEVISDRPWDARQYVVEDPNGYRLKIAEPLDEDDDDEGDAE